jgi:hypothetical protein
MGRRAWLNLWLAAALAVLVWVVWQEPGHAPKPIVKLTALKPAAIEHITLTNRSGTLKLAKQNGGWQLQAPLQIAADGVRVDDLLQVAEAESHSQFSAPGKGLAPFGLDKPVVTLRLNGTELKFGGTTPVDQQRYVQIGDVIHLIDDRYSFDLDANADAYVSRDLVPSGADLNAIALPGLNLGRGKDGKWSATPAPPGISQQKTQEKIKALADAWRGAQALRVAAYDKRPAQGTISLSLAGGQTPLRYAIIARQPELILARPELGLQFYLAGEEAARLLELKPAADDDKDKHKEKGK